MKFKNGEWVIAIRFMGKHKNVKRKNRMQIGHQEVIKTLASSIAI